MVRKRLTIPVRTLFLGRADGGRLSHFFYLGYRNLYILLHLRQYMSRQFMTQWGANEAERLIQTGRVKRMDLTEARRIISDDSTNGWLGFPEGEMVAEYNSNRLLVAKYVLWTHETINEALANLA